MRYRLPFFDYFGPNMYLDASKKGLRIGFMQGTGISSVFPEEEMWGRKLIADAYLNAKIADDQLLCMVWEAIQLQELRQMTKLTKKVSRQRV